MSPGDLYGFLALFFMIFAAIMMLFRTKLLKWTKSLGAVRSIHVATSTLAGFFLILHISNQYLPPNSTGVILGYTAVFASVIVWLTGTMFLEKVKDTLFFHGVISGLLIPLSMIHAATTGSNIPFFWIQILVATTAAVIFANAALQLKRAWGSAPR